MNREVDDLTVEDCPLLVVRVLLTLFVLFGGDTVVGFMVVDISVVDVTGVSVVVDFARSMARAMIWGNFHKFQKGSSLFAFRLPVELMQQLDHRRQLHFPHLLKCQE